MGTTSEGQTAAKASTTKGDVVYDGDSDESDEGVGGSEEDVQEAKAEESEGRLIFCMWKDFVSV